MTQERKKDAIWRVIYFRILNVHLKNIIKHVPILSAAINGWQFASLAFADSSEGYRRKQEWKSFYGALINPKFASKWFKILNSPDLLEVVLY